MTGYVVHYSDGDTDRNESVPASSTSALITSLTLNFTYNFSVEAKSEHFPGESQTQQITLTQIEFHTISPTGMYPLSELLQEPMLLCYAIAMLIIHHVHNNHDLVQINIIYHIYYVTHMSLKTTLLMPNSSTDHRGYCYLHTL